ncbi:LOW QUALITY PROTEIN: leucine-rich repeat-containing protein 40 [Drosophila nasuta]|uniref:LOW QUALITY PROTEIN: leucine-rich repeat-containing protein 40 n=1 Tax=Drosophila nasuta TaxID=42062 RepID=UPI00295E5E92|nr:LOW QUALITY PROTEIN: leucine-rich repeat-containing protein 40 [Drosophila nasuta]
MKMVGDGLNSPRQQGGKAKSAKSDPQFPDKYSMRNTRVLKANSKNLTELPEDIVEMACHELVDIVSLQDNLLTKVPSELQNMSELLTELNLSKNQISFIPSFISQFSRLLRINLSGNLLRSLPMELAGLKMLRELNISHNRYEQLPTCIYELESLETLIANDNQIQEIDATDNGLGGLPKLGTLNLTNNNIQIVPPVLGNLTSIDELHLSGNPFRQPRHQILAMGTASIMEYLRNRIPL